MLKSVVVLLAIAGHRLCSGLSDAGCKKQTTSDGFVCVCNGDACDAIPPPPALTEGAASVVQTSKAGDVMAAHPNVEFSSTSNSSGKPTIAVSRSSRFQTLLGLGGAFTDAASMNIVNLSSKAQQFLLESYYSEEGIRYSIGRIPMASCDFSTHEYSYDDSAGDFDLTNFSLADEDVRLKIPLLQRAAAMSSVPLRLFGSPWSAPGWMKTNDEMHGRGQLKGQAGDKYHKTWAMYFVR